MARYLLSLLSSVFLVIAGCQSSPPRSSAFYQKSSEPTLPPVNFFTMKPSANLSDLCEKQRCFMANDILDGIYSQLQATGVFQGVGTGPNANADYSVYAVVRGTLAGNTAEELAGAALAGATLLLVPATEKREYHSEFVVTWHGFKLGEYAVNLPYDYKISLYDTPAKQNTLVSEQIVAEFISSVQGEKVFTSERIYEVLKAEDYHKDLKAPLQVGNYRHKDFMLFPDPRAGVQLRYENQKSQSEIADVFVYPIRRLDWSDTGKVTSDELNIALKDIDLAVKAGVYKSAQFGAPKPASFGVDGKAKGWVSEGKVNWSDGRTTTDFIYVFTAKDKYLKLRFSLSEPKPDSARLNEFVSGFVHEVVVPEESFFMASLRQKQRSSSSQ